MRHIRRTFNYVEHGIICLIVFVFLLFGTASPRHRFLLLFPSPVTKQTISWFDTPPNPSYRMKDFPLDPYSYDYGQCNWYVQIRNWDEPLDALGDAKDWPVHAIMVGLPVGTIPRVGSTVVFQPGIDGADNITGHVAHVEAVYTGNVFLISEMNAAGGWGVVSWRYIFPDPSLRFIY